MTEETKLKPEIASIFKIVFGSNIDKPLFACGVATMLCIIMCFVYNAISSMTFLALVSAAGIVVFFVAATKSFFVALGQFLIPSCKQYRS